MSFQCGIVGLPNVGKSTLYNALTSAAAAAENYPFCTIEPNVGIVPVPDPRLGRIAGFVRARARGAGGDGVRTSRGWYRRRCVAACTQFLLAATVSVRGAACRRDERAGHERPRA